MSPNAYIQWNDDTQLLEGFQGEELNENPIFIWTYSVFEAHLNESITPSMYNFMASYVEDNMTKEDLYEIQGGGYCGGCVEEEAVDAYFDTPILTRIEMHDQQLANLTAQNARARAKEAAFIDAHLDEKCPFDPASPLYIEYANWCSAGVEKWKHIHEQLESAICEEEQWTSGAEMGAEDMQE